MTCGAPKRRLAVPVESMSAPDFELNPTAPVPSAAIAARGTGSLSSPPPTPKLAACVQPVGVAAPAAAGVAASSEGASSSRTSDLGVGMVTQTVRAGTRLRDKPLEVSPHAAVLTR